MAVFQGIEEIEVWKRACRLAVDIYAITRDSAFDKDWSLRDQMRRAAVSIPSNVAEGFERGGGVEFNRFVRIAKGSCAELRTQVYIAHAIGYIDKPMNLRLIAELKEISAMLSGLSKYLKENKR